VNYNEDEEDSVNEDDLMPNEHGEVWTYGNSESEKGLSVVEEPEAQEAIDAIVDHREIILDGIRFLNFANCQIRKSVYRRLQSTLIRTWSIVY
jgi:hypothetical protein